ncbi:uncharacterized protein B0P05DRAFT_639279 [Gilbertella persicaria]|uniref:uncharacterized protein n=1 Tax=Gilbertella persicaria TaxID=101096 RepID=UPI00222107E6|nr:uncharacterized protein B0P05DRAFT_639279 [Gilbertella persicaria]KAI8069741.1 hypothetical protein B0P05DRAFT_639279 [Gilbertella persicaria]
MTKESNTPKAINIIRPNSSHYLLNTSHSSSTNGSITSNNSTRRPSSVLSGTSSTSHSRKPRVVKDNIYQPPSRKPSYDDYSRVSTRPPIELYKPPQQHKNKSIPSHDPIKIVSHRPPTNKSQYHRSVLGVINTPANHEDQPISSEDNDDDDDDDQQSVVDLDELSDKEQNEQPIEEQEEEGEDEPVLNEARVNRKIEDLELTVKSLLTVNAMLEATVRKQASQLNQVKKSGQVSMDTLLEPPQDIVEPVIQSDSEEEWENDALFQKLKKLTEQLIEQGQKSVDFEYKILGRVLSNYEPLDQVQEEEEEDAGKIIVTLDLCFDSRHSGTIETIPNNTSIPQPPPPPPPSTTTTRRKPKRKLSNKSTS